MRPEKLTKSKPWPFVCAIEEKRWQRKSGLNSTLNSLVDVRGHICMEIKVSWKISCIGDLRSDAHSKASPLQGAQRCPGMVDKSKRLWQKWVLQTYKVETYLYTHKKWMANDPKQMNNKEKLGWLRLVNIYKQILYFQCQRYQYLI